MPYYRTEPASAAVEALLLAQATPVLISELTRVGFASALARWVRVGELTEPQANRVESAFYEDVAAGRFQVVPLVPATFQRATHWLLSRRTALRTLDALHLACTEANEARLVTLDTALADAAEYLGVTIYRF